MERRKTILVVDDVPDDIAVLEGILKSEYQVKAVTSGPAALRVAMGEAPPDLILLDIMMPGMDGFEVCRRLREGSGGSSIPVIFLTAKNETSDEKMGLELGAVDYIRKPVDPAILQARIRSNLEQKDRIIRISEIRYRRLFETARDGIMIVDLASGKIIDLNPACSRLLGMSQELLLGARPHEIEGLSAVLAAPENLRDMGMRTGSWRSPAPIFRNASEEAPYLEIGGSLYTVNGRELLQLSFRDVSPIARYEAELRYKSATLERALEQKNELLREVHHRVKNNMQVIMSLLYVSAEQFPDPRLRGKIEDITRRLHVMASVHEYFYESEDLAEIDFSRYLFSCVDALRSDYTVPGQKLSVLVNVEPVFLGLEKAIPAALIAGELVANALRHAFPGKEQGVVRVGLVRLPEGRLELTVADDGMGLPEGISPGSGGHLGMMLVDSLARQLSGTLHIDRAEGTRAILRFPS